MRLCDLSCCAVLSLLGVVIDEIRLGVLDWDWE